MKCGEFRKNASHRIVIQSMSNAGDSYGGETTNWQTHSTVWAAIEPLIGKEVYAQSQRQSKVNTKIIIRYQASLKSTKSTGAYRVSYDGRIFPILYIKNMTDDFKNEGKSFQILYCQENEGSEQ